MDDEARRTMRSTFSHLSGAERDSAIVRDVAKLRNATAGDRHAANRLGMDRVLDSYFSLVVFWEVGRYVEGANRR